MGIHAHRNYGTATACALAGVEAGASNVETCVNGLADGAGLAAFDEVVMVLAVMMAWILEAKSNESWSFPSLCKKLPA